MPYQLSQSKKCWQIIHKETGQIHSQCSSKKKALAQIRLMEQLVSGAGWFSNILDKIAPKRKAGVLPPQVRKFLEKNGNEAITSLVVVRTPLDKFLTGLVNVISLGEFSKGMRANSYDSMFHLTLFINGKYQYEKLEVVSLKAGNPVKTKSETMQVGIPAGWNATFQQFIDKHKQLMGDEAYSDYDPFQNNCQDFLISALEANGLLTTALRNFIKQPVEGIVEQMPSWTGKISKSITDAAARFNRFIQGENIKHNNNKKMKKHTNAIQHGGFLGALALALAPTLLGKILGNGVHGGSVQQGGFLPGLLMAIAPTLLGKILGNGIHGGSIDEELGKFLPSEARDQILNLVQKMIHQVVSQEDFSNLTGKAKKAYELLKREIPAVVQPVENMVSTQVVPRAKKALKAIKGEGVIRRGGSWVQALKKYNEGKKWTVPKKGSAEYEKVRQIQQNLR